jgi:uncharacterized protein YutE (UPF0331/DUF86 family)
MAPRPLPMPIKTRLAETRKHALALKALVEGTTRETFVAAVAQGSPDALLTTVYPLERAFEILVKFVVELTELGLQIAEIVPGGSGAKVLDQLAAEGVISKSRRERLAAIYRARNEMQHAYPDVGAQATYDAAGALLEELGGFLGDYARWLRGLGYGSEA